MYKFISHMGFLLKKNEQKGDKMDYIPFKGYLGSLDDVSDIKNKREKPGSEEDSQNETPDSSKLEDEYGY